MGKRWLTTGLPVAICSHQIHSLCIQAFWLYVGIVFLVYMSSTPAVVAVAYCDRLALLVKSISGTRHYLDPDTRGTKRPDTRADTLKTETASPASNKDSTYKT